MSNIDTNFKLLPIKQPIRIEAVCSAFISEYDVDFFFAGEAHDFYEAVFILEGKAGITAGSEILNLQEGQMIFHPPMEFHRIWNASDSKLRILVFSFSLENDMLADHCVRRFDAAQARSMVECVRNVRECCVVKATRIDDFREGVSLLPLHIAINEIEGLFMSLLSNEQSESSAADHTRRARNYTEAVSYLQNNLHCRLTVDEIAHHCNMSRSALQKMFLRYAGVGVMTYYHRMEIIRATELLKSGCSVKETAAALGFEDQNYFSRFYRTHTGMPPSRRKRGL